MKENKKDFIFKLLVSEVYLALMTVYRENITVSSSKLKSQATVKNSICFDINHQRCFILLILSSKIIKVASCHFKGKFLKCIEPLFLFATSFYGFQSTNGLFIAQIKPIVYHVLCEDVHLISVCELVNFLYALFNQINHQSFLWQLNYNL